MGNITRIVLNKRIPGKGTPLYQYDYGQVIQFMGVSLPETYEVHFSNTDQIGTAKAQIGDSNGVLIPDEYLLTGQPVYVWVFLHTGTGDGETEYKCIIPVIKRARKEDAEPTPIQQDAITQAIAALNTAVESTSADADSAMASQMMAAQSEQNAKLSEQAVAQSESNAARLASLTLASEQAAASSEANARASEQNASISESAAATSAREALQSQISASYLESSARSSASSAKTSEDNAQAAWRRVNQSEAVVIQNARSASEKAIAAEASAIAAEASRRAIENLSVLANTLQPGQQATVTKQVDSSGNVTLVFGIPEGVSGGALYS